MDHRDVATRPAEGPDAVLRYADHRDGVVDIFLPLGAGASAPYRLVVFMHGGFWREEWNRMHARPLANALARRGLVVAVPEYRRVGGAGGWPQTGGRRGGRARRTARDVERGGARIRRSAGAEHPDRPLRRRPPRYVVRTASRASTGLCDRGVGAGLPTCGGRPRPAWGDGAVPALLGGPPAECPQRYDEADVIALLSGGCAASPSSKAIRTCRSPWR